MEAVQTLIDLGAILQNLQQTPNESTSLALLGWVQQGGLESLVPDLLNYIDSLSSTSSPSQTVVVPPTPQSIEPPKVIFAPIDVNGVTKTYEMTSTTTIGELRKTIANQLAVSPDQIQITSAGNEILEDPQDVAGFLPGLTVETTNEPEADIPVKIGGAIETVRVPRTATVDELIDTLLGSPGPLSRDVVKSHLAVSTSQGPVDRNDEVYPIWVANDYKPIEIKMPVKTEQPINVRIESNGHPLDQQTYTVTPATTFGQLLEEVADYNGISREDVSTDWPDDALVLQRWENAGYPFITVESVIDWSPDYE